jgi:chitin synthase
MSLGTESYAPSRNMFQNVDKKALLEKEALPGEIHEGEVAEVLKETSARRRWVALCWLLTWWVPSPFLRWFGRMKRMDVRQAWREKLALNMIIWLMCACAVFVIAILGNLICPTEHVFSTSELAGHTVENSPENVYVAIRGEVFDLTQVSQTHLRVVPVVPEKSVLKYGGTIADDLFPVQVIYLLVFSYSRSSRVHRSARFATVFPEASAHMSLSTSTTTPILTHSTMISESSRMIRGRTGTSRA